MSENQVNQHFVGLVLSLHSSAWIHLGKVANPATGKPERNLDAAREVIDLLGALDEKSRGNRAPDEDKLMSQVLTELRMNYVDELERSKKEDAASEASDVPEAGDAPGASDAQEGGVTPQAGDAPKASGDPDPPEAKPTDPGSANT